MNNELKNLFDAHKELRVQTPLVPLDHLQRKIVEASTQTNWRPIMLAFLGIITTAVVGIVGLSLLSHKDPAVVVVPHSVGSSSAGAQSLSAPSTTIESIPDLPATTSNDRRGDRLHETTEPSKTKEFDIPSSMSGLATLELSREEEVALGIQRSASMLRVPVSTVVQINTPERKLALASMGVDTTRSTITMNGFSNIGLGSLHTLDAGGTFSERPTTPTTLVVTMSYMYTFTDTGWAQRGTTMGWYDELTSFIEDSALRKEFFANLDDNQGIPREQIRIMGGVLGLQGVIVPLHTTIGDTTEGLNNSFTDVFLWFVPNTFLKERLSKSSRERIDHEQRVISQIRSSSVSQAKACETLEQPSVLGICGISENSLSTLAISPQPVSDEATIRFESSVDGAADIALYDMNGVLQNIQIPRATITRGMNAVQINLRSLPSGVYVIRVEGAAGSLSTRLLKR